jgi:hypothetical protein
MKDLSPKNHAEAIALFRKRSADPIFRVAPTRAGGVHVAPRRYSAGMVNEPTRAASSSGRSLARVAFQLLGASSR